MRCIAMRAGECRRMWLREWLYCANDRIARTLPLSGSSATPEAAITNPRVGGIVGGESGDGRPRWESGLRRSVVKLSTIGIFETIDDQSRRPL